MTAFSNTFDTSAPDGGDDPAEADNNMRRIQAAIQERENVDHYWPLTGTEVSDADAGEHRKLIIRTLSAGEVAALSATKAYLYRLVTDGELYFKDASNNTIKLTVGGILNSLNLTGAQTAAGVKTFSSSPIVPAPTTNLQAATKKYVDEHGTVQIVNTQTGAVSSGNTTVIPNDDTIPQNIEGDEFMTLAITPTSATNKLKIDVVFIYSADQTRNVGIALFQDTTANALAAIQDSTPVEGDRVITSSFSHYMTAGTTSETTFKVRAGVDVAGQLHFNGISIGRKFGGVLVSSITITEIKA